jgi:hypothetical protein
MFKFVFLVEMSLYFSSLFLSLHHLCIKTKTFYLLSAHRSQFTLASPYCHFRPYLSSSRTLLFPLLAPYVASTGIDLCLVFNETSEKRVNLFRYEGLQMVYKRRDVKCQTNDDKELEKGGIEDPALKLAS